MMTMNNDNDENENARNRNKGLGLPRDEYKQYITDDGTGSNVSQSQLHWDRIMKFLNKGIHFQGFPDIPNKGNPPNPHMKFPNKGIHIQGFPGYSPIRDIH